ncbi:MAG: tetratricopeptide repeat protein [Bdellovibrionaceae bacterium]|nr:tetratricopeptide repeat protein [Pseudobdellovibrionaceae bacterium]
MSQHDESLWLLKSSGRILGPYSLKKVSDLLRSKEIVPLDEVCLPKKRWQYLRDQKEFHRVIEEIRVQQIKSASENTETMGAQVDDMTASVTEALQNAVSDELTGDIEPLNDELTQDIPIRDIIEDTARDVSDTGRMEEGIKSKRYGTQEIAKKNVQSFSKTVWNFTFVTVVIVSVILLTNHFLIKPRNKNSMNLNDLTIANAFYTNGKYTEALKYYKKAYQSNPENKEPYIRYGTLLIALDRQTVEGKRILNEAMEFDPRNRVYSLAGMGLANLFEQDLNSAEKNFNEVLKLDPNLTSAIINLGWMAEINKDIKKAIENYSSSIIKGSGRLDNSAYIYLSKALISLWKETGNLKYLNEAKNNLLSIVDDRLDYRQEGLFLLSYIYSQLDQAELFFETMEKLLDTDPYLTREHAHDLNVYHDGISWSAFFNMCEEIYKKHNQEASAVTLSGYCALRAEKFNIAEMRFTELVNIRTKNPLLLAHHAFFLQVMDRGSASALTLGKAIEENKKNKKYNLPLVLQARSCQTEQDISCAIEKWQELSDKDEKSIEAKSYLVLLKAQQGQFSGLDSLVREARSISPNYAPAKYAETFLYDSKNK